MTILIQIPLQFEQPKSTFLYIYLPYLLIPNKFVVNDSICPQASSRSNMSPSQMTWYERNMQIMAAPMRTNYAGVGWV